MQTNPSTLALVRWMASITRSVHLPLLVSTVFRIITQSLEIALFAAAGFTLAGALTDSFKPGLLWLVVGLALTRALTHYLEQFTGHYVAFNALEVLRGHAFASLWPKAPGIILRQHSGSLLTGLTRDVDRIEVVYAHTFAPLISAVVVPALALGITGLVFGFGVIAVPLLCVLVSVLVIPMLGFKRSVAVTEQTLATRSSLTENLSDTVHGTAEVLTYGRQEDRLAQAAEKDDAVLTSSLAPARIKAFRRAANLLLNLVTVASLVISAFAFQLEPAWTLALVLGATRLFEAPRGIENAVGYLDYSLSAARRLWSLAHAPSSIIDGSKTLTLDAAPRLEWQNVSYTYPSATAPSLHEISFTAEAGKHIVLIGHSGSGKSTAVQLLLRFDEVAGGQILLNGAPITDYTADSLRSQVVLVSQKSQMLAGTIAENLRLGAVHASDDELWDALATAEIADEIRAMPAGLATDVGTDASGLSGGQAQRLALARALLMHPKVLVLDEFTANLNTALQQKIRANLTALQGKVTMIEISHRTDHLPTADRIVRFDQGRAEILAHTPDLP